MSEWPYDLRWFTPYSTHLILCNSDLASLWPYIIVSLTLFLTCDYVWPFDPIWFKANLTHVTSCIMNDLRQPLWLSLFKKLRKKLDFSVRKFWAAFYKGTLWLGLKTSHSCGMIAVNQLLFACEKFGEVCKSLIVMNISWRKPNPCHTIVITTPVLIRLGREN